MYSFLLADDEPLIRKGTLKKIIGLDLAISCAFEAENGQQAIDFLKKNTVDFIITDMDMPKIDGSHLLDYLKTNQPQIPIIVISGYQNFDYVQKAIQSKAINYILKPFSKKDLATSLNDVIQILGRRKNELIENTKRFLKALESDEVISDDHFHKLNISGNKYYQLFIAEIKKKTIHLNELKLNSIYHSTYPEDGNLHFFVLEKNMIDEVHLDCNENLHGALSDVFFLPMNTMDSTFKEAYQQTINLLNWRKSNTQPIMISEDIANTPQPFFDRLTLNTYMYLIESGQSKAFRSSFSEELNILYNEKDIPLIHIKELGLVIIERSKLFLDNFYQMQSNYTYPSVQHTLLYRMFQYEQVRDYLLHFLGNIADSMAYEKLYSSSDLVVNVRDYIRNHFEEPLTLSFLADLFYVNSSYLSLVFKERTGMKYVDYLNQLRINKAKELLTETSAKADFISKKIGYDNVKYFFKVFKKYTNETPEQYRERTKSK
ncbi:response regulator transcription factor [Enterococcus sp. RIT-PI-f]|uniref:response regulator transcription factor n=1 Tax=Enterococcus sp. RIT-PI-f TaxID=1690244 RepID=UPI0006B9ECA8|nr:response regulator [Enterococcus sp. RIT-PI-f]KPG70434.1 hypothetical protein AEQ18_07615 [Enterococcus sp. RIT-PI-f]